MDIDLYIETVYHGFYPLYEIYERFIDYYWQAVETAKLLDWDEVVLYAIFAYNRETQGFVAADFMCLRMPYSRYVALCSKISKNCRVFCLRNT
ncbi:MAG: hypothetical protein MJ100_07970 [Ruminococcus sp.]|nr:hypothetical protein [Ruminococcus sp.]